MTGPLSHIRVLELSRVLAGPWAAQTLGDLGAEVIKVERAGTGDDTRGWGPPFLNDRDGNPTRESSYFQSANRGKKSIAVDMSKPQGRDLVHGLAAKSDVVIENFRVGGATKLGVGYEDLTPLNPSLIYCSITGFGQTGPYKDRGGYDYVIQAMGGLMSITGERDDRPGGGPQKVGLAVSDLFTGMYATVSICAALAHRERTGQGQYIDLALLDCTAAILSMMATNYFASGKVPARLGNAHPNVVPYQLFDTTDGKLAVAIGNDGQFARYCAAIGKPDLVGDPRFKSNADRIKHRTEIEAILIPLMKSKTTAQWQDELGASAVPFGPVNTIDQVFEDPQILSRGMKLELPHSAVGTTTQPASPINMSATPVSYRRSAPMLGEHTNQVLREVLGLDDAAVAALRADGAI